MCTCCLSTDITRTSFVAADGIRSNDRREWQLDCRHEGKRDEEVRCDCRCECGRVTVSADDGSVFLFFCCCF